MKYIKIEELKGRKYNNKKIYGVFNKKENYSLGEIIFYLPWKQYCFCPSLNKIFSYECLQDISNFIMNLKKLSEAGKNGAKAGKILKDKIIFEPNEPPPIY